MSLATGFSERAPCGLALGRQTLNDFVVPQEFDGPVDQIVDVIVLLSLEINDLPVRYRLEFAGVE
jgi:hypothetical protein